MATYRRRAGFRLPSQVLIDNYWIPRREVAHYQAQRQYWRQTLMDWMTQQGWRAEAAFEGSQDGLAIVGLDSEGQLQALIHLDPATLAALAAGVSPADLC